MWACILRSLMFDGGRLRLEGRATPSAQTLSVQSGKGCPAEAAAGEEWAPCCHQAGGRNPLDCELVGRTPALSGRWMSSLPPPAVLWVHELSGWNFFFLCHFLETATPPHLLCSNITRAISLFLAPCIVVQPHPQELIKSWCPQWLWRPPREDTPGMLPWLQFWGTAWHWSGEATFRSRPLCSQESYRGQVLQTLQAWLSSSVK